MGNNFTGHSRSHGRQCQNCIVLTCLVPRVLVGRELEEVWATRAFNLLRRVFEIELRHSAGTRSGYLVVRRKGCDTWLPRLRGPDVSVLFPLPINTDRMKRNPPTDCRLTRGELSSASLTSSSSSSSSQSVSTNSVATDVGLNCCGSCLRLKKVFWGAGFWRISWYVRLSPTWKEL